MRPARPLSANSCARVFSSAGVSSCTGAEYCTISTPSSAVITAEASAAAATGSAAGRVVSISSRRFISSSKVGSDSVSSAILRLLSSTDSSAPKISAAGSVAGSAAGSSVTSDSVFSGSSSEGFFSPPSVVGRSNAQFTVFPSDLAALPSALAALRSSLFVVFVVFVLFSVSPESAEFSPLGSFPASASRFFTSTSARNIFSREAIKSMDAM